MSQHRNTAIPERQILDAAYELLLAVGMRRMNMADVARRAGVSRATLYRRWANKDRLVFAAIEHYRQAHPVTTPDTGTLRGDLIALLSAINEARATFWAVATATAFSGLLTDTGLTPAKAREKVLGDQPPLHDRAIYRRAHERGEIDLDRVPPAVLAMPYELMRHDLLMNLEPLPRARIESIIDELFLPLVRSHRGEPGAAEAT